MVYLHTTSLATFILQNPGLHFVLESRLFSGNFLLYQKNKSASNPCVERDYCIILSHIVNPQTTLLTSRTDTFLKTTVCGGLGPGVHNTVGRPKKNMFPE